MAALTGPRTIRIASDEGRSQPVAPRADGVVCYMGGFYAFNSSGEIVVPAAGQQQRFGGFAMRNFPGDDGTEEGDAILEFDFDVEIPYNWTGGEIGLTAFADNDNDVVVAAADDTRVAIGEIIGYGSGNSAGKSIRVKATGQVARITT